MTESADWLARPYLESDLEGLLYLLGVSYTRSRAGIRAGADRAGGALRGQSEAPASRGASLADAKAREQAFLEAHRPIWLWLLRHGDVQLLVDPEEPEILWAWLITTGDSVVHALGCKRSFTDRKTGGQPLSIDLALTLAGPRLGQHQVCTLELPQMRRFGPGTIGMDRPREWSLDPTWLVTHMGTV